MDILNAVDRFAQDRSLAGMSPSSVSEYRRNLYNFAEYLESHGLNHTREVTAQHVREWLCACMCRNRQATLCHKRSIVKLWLEWLVANELCSADLSAIPQVSPPHPDEIRRLQVNELQVYEIFDHLRKRYRQTRGMSRLRELSLAALLFGAGMRVGEVAALEVSDVNLPARELTIRHPKNNRSRVIALPGSVVAILRLWLWRRGKLGIKARALFYNSGGDCFASESLARLIQRRAREIGLEITSHTGRRYCLTHLAYVNLLLAKQQAGHLRLETTQAYLREDIRSLKRALRYNDPLRSGNCTR